VGTFDDFVHRIKADAFLVRLNILAQGDTTVRHNAAAVGHGMHLPLEDVLDVVETLEASGDIHRCSRLIDGPLVHLTARGSKTAGGLAA
jgi:hypothetical protein